MDEYRDCPDCAEEIKRAAKVCRFCGWGKKSGRGRAPKARRRHAPTRKSGAIAFMLAALLPMGCGHFYADEPGRGVAVFAGSVLIFVGVVLAARTSAGMLLMLQLAALVLYVGQVADAVAATGRANAKSSAVRR